MGTGDGKSVQGAALVQGQQAVVAAGQSGETYRPLGEQGEEVAL